MVSTAFVDRPGSRVYYEASGTGSGGYLLLHGWSCDHVSMRPVAAYLADRGHRVANMDLRGHGQSTLDTPAYSSQDVVQDMLAVAERAGIERPVLVGHSLGAKFVLAFAHAHPARTRAIVLLDTSIVESRQRQAKRLAEVEQDRPDDLRRRLESMFLADDQSEQRREAVESMMRVPRPVAAAALRAGDEVDTATALASCELPVLYVAASRPGEDPQLMRHLNPRLRFGQVVGSGHFVQLEAPVQVNAMIEQFVRLYGTG
jgi:pimeloyl-ACP methyl ester carboxylesterase